MKVALLAMISACGHGYTLTSATATSARVAIHHRAPSPTANLFENLGTILDYNKKYIGTAISSMFDDRTATASHILFSFAKYDDGDKRAEALKICVRQLVSIPRPIVPFLAFLPCLAAHAERDRAPQIEAGDLSFSDAAKEFSTCPSAAKGGSLGEFKKGAMVPEFDAVVVSDPMAASRLASVAVVRILLCGLFFSTR